ncbi:TniQ family protein [Pseudoalteromonas luteoviolacea]|uniref:TniQ family protein n=1 Tax=Pseudoalteromonas luteoviolacea TaxID=43657 RepID=UPI00114E27DF|nr:TniQ family protein [Pseudoalteromonas luteoviolacea]TQF70009.1 TniQ family protein [Pseudoalteromonas luteoviolacea]
MQFLSQTAPYPDETTESYLLRLSQDNGYLGFADMADILWDWLVTQDHELEGAFPNELPSVDVYKASQSSNFRVRALRLVAQLAGVEASELLNLCWLRSNTQFGAIAAVSRNGLLVPRQLLRKSGIPVCTECLKQDAHIPYLWHFRAYKACHKHNQQLTRLCGQCNAEIDYRASEAFLECECGGAIKQGPKANQADYKLANALARGAAAKLVGLMAWFSQWQSISYEDDKFSELFVSYFSNWPNEFEDELINTAELAKVKQLRPFNHTPFSNVFGDLLKNSKLACAGSQGYNVVQQSIITFLTKLVEQHPKKKHPNLGDLLLSMLDAAVVLSTNTEQVFRLYEEGFLTVAQTPKKNAFLKPSDNVFYLRQVIELQQSFAPNIPTHQQQYVPPW